jgi:hypothetical protein
MAKNKEFKAKVEILKVGHAMFLGARGEAGGAPSKDSVFGVAVVQGTVLTFGGRRGGTLRFKTYKKDELEAQLARFDKKLAGRPFGKNVDATYNLLDAAAQAELLGADFATQLGKGFYAATFNKKLNTYSRVPKAKAAPATENTAV